MNDEKLIELVREYEFLYNTKHPKYTSPSKKDMAWKNIADELQQTPTTCKERWQILRCAYKRALKKRKLKIWQAPENRKKWTYENEMEFLLPFFIDRKVKEKPKIPDKGRVAKPVESDENESESDDNDTESSTTMDGDGCNSRMLEEIEINTDVAPIKTEHTSSILLDTLGNHGPRHDELDRFFLSIADTVKKFSPYQQAVAKNQIFSIVSDMELQQLAPTRSTGTKRRLE